MNAPEHIPIFQHDADIKAGIVNIYEPDNPDFTRCPGTVFDMRFDTPDALYRIRIIPGGRKRTKAAYHAHS
ncbi:hypothetical protein [Inquilinus limosus]|uniref:Cupin n=1 Tax=Inquilinus limosus MP06 TaxID=1398085 RepID=A0A0A0DE27_9PROT|nr:hypothetical protein [Inquilinus limosus]KGM36153.1 hypothetical protein P409_00460 [Inquilinus limosus MP06]